MYVRQHHTILFDIVDQKRTTVTCKTNKIAIVVTYNFPFIITHTACNLKFLNHLITVLTYT